MAPVADKATSRSGSAKSDATKRDSRYYSPAWLLGITVACILLGESFLMLALPLVEPLQLSPLGRALFDACSLALLLLPALHWLFYRPMARHIRKRQKSEEALQQSHTMLEQRVREKTAALARKEALSQYLLRRVIDATEDERKRVARELHDHTGQTLTSLIAGLGALRENPDAAHADDLLGLAVQTLEEVHDLSVDLRPSALDDLGLVVALEKHCQSFAVRCGVRVECETVGIQEGTRFPSEMEVALYRIVQEALTNAVRHGRARFIQILLQHKDTALLVVIEDDGCGFDAVDWRSQCERGNHLGLLGIEERVTLLGGALRVESQVGSSTSLFVNIPLEETRHE